MRTPLSRTTTASAAVLTAVLAAALTAGCNGSTDGVDREDPAPEDDAPVWSVSTDPVATDGLVWSNDDVVHLPDGTTVDVGEPTTTYVVAGDGVYFTPAGDDAGHSSTTTGPLHFADRDGEVTDTGITVYVESIGSSRDGRYLGFVDATSGPEDRFSGQPRGTAVVVDLTSGDRVVETADGMGDPDEDDLAHDYPEVYLGVRFPDSGEAVVEGLGNFLYTLPSGEGEPTETGPRSPTDPVSPGEEWTIEDRGFDDRIVARDGTEAPVRTGTPRRDLRCWLDASTVVGIAIAGPGSGKDLGADNTSTLVTCTVPGGTCEEVPGTAGARIRFPVGAGDERLDLGASGSGS